MKISFFFFGLGHASGIKEIGALTSGGLAHFDESELPEKILLYLLFISSQVKTFYR